MEYMTDQHVKTIGGSESKEAILAPKKLCDISGFWGGAMGGGGDESRTLMLSPNRVYPGKTERLEGKRCMNDGHARTHQNCA